MEYNSACIPASLRSAADNTVARVVFREAGVEVTTSVGEVLVAGTGDAAEVHDAASLVAAVEAGASSAAAAAETGAAAASAAAAGAAAGRTAAGRGRSKTDMKGAKRQQRPMLQEGWRIALRR
mmetsp:Transcript_137536/g.343173  ORF Transcript_137536/g.343173 Transcript_137536/m.343173 type:complete len:123 (+) Transcript_137536:829-1197(+)